MKKFLIITIIFAMTSSITAVASTRDHTPLRYREHPKTLKYAGTVIHGNSSKTSIMHLNYDTGKGFNYNTGALCNYNTKSGFNYNTATNLKYR